MASKKDLQVWAVEALRLNKGSLSLIEICKYGWDHY